MSMLRRTLFTLAALATVWFASGFLSQAHAESYPIQALNATITLPERWVRDAPALEESELSSDYRGVFYATRDEGRQYLGLTIMAATGEGMLSSDNLDDADPAELKLLRETFRTAMGAENISTLRTAQTTALCFYSKDLENQEVYTAYLRYRGIDIFVMVNASAGRQLMSRDYEMFRSIVASLVFETSRAPRTAGEPFLGQEAARAWMEALEADLKAKDVWGASFEYAASAQLASGTNAVHYVLNYGGYDASVLLEYDPAGQVRDINLWFPCGAIYLDKNDPRKIEDLYLVLCASGLFLRDVGGEQVAQLTLDLFRNIMDAMEGAPPRQWIWRYGIGFYGSYLPETQSVLVILRVGEPEAL